MESSEQFKRDMMASRNDDDDFRRHYLGSWEPPAPIDDERVETLATNLRAAEFVRTEEVMNMAREILRYRSQARNQGKCQPL